ncbi:MAG: contractile injection system tape measure protein [Methylobacter sp.]
MAANVHVIRQQILHVEVNGTETEALALQNRLSGLCRDWLLPAIERVLDRCVPAEGNWSVERLEIDAGTLSLERLEQDLTELVEKAVEEALQEQIMSKALSPTDTFNNTKHKTTQQGLIEALGYFLKTGSLPWALRLPEGKSFEQVLLENWQETDDSVISRDLNSTLTLASARKRLIRQFSAGFLAVLLKRMSPEGKKVMDDILAILRSFDVPAVAIKQFERQLWETVFACIPTPNLLTDRFIAGESWRNLPVELAQQSELMNLLERHWPGLIQDVSPWLSTQKAEEKLENPLPLAERKNFIPDTPVIVKDRPHEPALAPENPKNQTPETTQNISTGIGGLVVSEKRPEKSLAKTLEKQQIQHPEAGEGIYIDNAGLVLLHPFLPRFFEGLAITAEDKLIQPERALCLLHFLTTGQLIAPEYELILCKILCNIPLETPVESDMALTDAEKEEAEALLEAVIRHWDVLRNTGINGLRGTFLLRSGKLSLRDDGDWLLQVESKSYDILLGQLPWGIGMIKLPWMWRMLWVEWSN